MSTHPEDRGLGEPEPKTPPIVHVMRRQRWYCLFGLIPIWRTVEEIKVHEDVEWHKAGHAREE